MTKQIVTFLFLLSIFFSKSYGMSQRLEEYNLEFLKYQEEVQMEMLKGHVIFHITFSSVLNCIFQFIDSSVYDEEVERREKVFDEHESLLLEGRLLSNITVEEFDWLFGDENILNLSIQIQKNVGISKIFITDDELRRKLLVEFENEFGYIKREIKRKLEIIRDRIVQKQYLNTDYFLLEEDFFILEKEDQELLELTEALCSSQDYSLSDSDESDEYYEIPQNEIPLFNPPEDLHFLSDEEDMAEQLRKLLK